MAGAEGIRVLLVHPPAVRPCEPPPGLARVAGAIRDAGGTATVWDANLLGMLWIMGRPGPHDTWTSRARRDLAGHLADLRSGSAFRHPDTHRRVVNDLNRLLAKNLGPKPWRLSLTDLEADDWSPLRSSDLARAFEEFDRNPFFALFSEELPRLLERERPQVVGFSLNYLSQALSVFAMAGFLRRVAPSVRLVVGGSLVSSWVAAHGVPEVARERFDLVVAGPGEMELIRFCRDAFEVVPCPVAAPCAGSGEVSLEPDYSGFPLREYLSPGLILPFAAADGCFWSNCAFCPEKAEGGVYRPLPADAGWKMISRQVKRHRPRLLHFCESAMSPAWMKKLVQEFDGGEGFPGWYGFARFDAPLDDPEFCRALRRSGCLMLQLGLESGSQRVLDDLYKGVELARAEAILENLAAAGIATYVYLLFGTPPESEAEARMTLEFVARHHREIGFLNLAIFNLPLAAPEAGRLATRAFNEGDLSLYLDFQHPRGWDRRAVRSFLDREFRPHPAIASILQRDPPFFTSNHAPFFTGGWLPSAVP